MILLLCALLQEAVPAAGLAKLPVREVTVFKDGHSFVLQEGEMAVDAAGDVVLDHLPQPVMGTFWAYSADPAAPLTAVVAGSRKVKTERAAINWPDLLEANPGASVTVTETSGERYVAEVGARTGDLTLFKTGLGRRFTPLTHIRDVTFRDEAKTKVGFEESRGVMTLKLARKEGRARVGMAYLQKGIRWIPSYRVSIDGKGQATIKLQATLVNEMVDLENVRTHLVIGVPSFAFQETIDPIALAQAAAQLSAVFQSPNAQTAYALSNALMTQAARMGEYRHAPEQGGAPAHGADLPGGKNEDLFIFSVEGITLKKGERMVLPVAEFTIPYKDVYTLDIAMMPPPELRQHLNNPQQQEMARLFHRPKVMHQIRLQNSSKFPLTTAPALILKNDRLIGQGMMTYASIGCTTDLELTAAVDLPVHKDEEELRRTPNAMQWHGNSFDRIDLQGSVDLHNRRGTPVEVEIVRYVLGEAHDVTGGGTVQKVNLYEEDGSAGRSGLPSWVYYGWQYPWGHVNSISKITWNLKLEPGKSVELGYAWHYFAR